MLNRELNEFEIAFLLEIYSTGERYIGLDDEGELASTTSEHALFYSEWSQMQFNGNFNFMEEDENYEIRELLGI